jgi:hypothetical protein
MRKMALCGCIEAVPMQGNLGERVKFLQRTFEIFERFIITGVSDNRTAGTGCSAVCMRYVIIDGHKSRAVISSSAFRA